ncbi:MAG: hypothetical protein MJE77_41910 [Proteobacteria bacterium]|nr:hypothetical protein [Pseudomonadota bacterium]
MKYEYQLTEKGFDAAGVLIAMMLFGDARSFRKAREPIRIYSRATDRRVQPVLVDAETGEPIDPRDLYAGPGPSFPRSESATIMSKLSGGLPAGAPCARNRLIAALGRGARRFGETIFPECFQGAGRGGQIVLGSCNLTTEL